MCDVFDKYSSDGTCVEAGDLNADIHRQDLQKSYRSRTLLDKLFKQRRLVSSSCISPTQPKCTFRSKDNAYRSTVDYICIPEYMRGCILDYDVNQHIPYNISDHYALRSTVSVFRSIIDDTNTHNIKLKWPNANEYVIKMYQTEVDKILTFTYFSNNQTHECNEHHIETYNTRIVHSLLYSSHMYIPRGRYRRYLKPFWKRDGLDVDHHRMRERRREWKDDGKNRDPDSISYRNYKDSKRVFRRKNRHSKQKYKEYVYKEIESSSEVDVGYFYKTVRRFKQSSSTINVLKYNDIEANTAQGIVQLWRNYFADLATENPESQNTKYLDTEKFSAESYSQTEPILSHQVTCDEIVSVIKSLKNNKAPGPDCIPMSF